MILGVKLWRLAVDSCFPRVWLKKHRVQCGWWLQGVPPFLVVTRESQSPCTFLFWVNAVEFYSVVTMFLPIWLILAIAFFWDSRSFHNTPWLLFHLSNC